jgi:hypothetical protein
MHIENTSFYFTWILTKELQGVKRFQENSVTPISSKEYCVAQDLGKLYAKSIFGHDTGGGNLINEKLLHSRDEERSNGDPTPLHY